jgi:single-strand DNA-binding protein
MNFNKAIIVGRLTRDPEEKALPSGQKVTNFSLATSRFFTDKGGNKQQASEFHNIVAFGRIAEVAGQYLKKGSMALIEGEIRTRKWEDQQGKTNYRTEIYASSLQLGPRSANAGGETPSPTPDQKEAPTKEEEIPVIEEKDIDINDIPF